MFPAVMMAEKPRPSWKTAEKIVSVSHEERAFSLEGKCIVVVEDEGMTQLQLRRILQAEGMLVVGRASNGREAIEVVLANKPDVVLMDIRMPVMDGLEASR